ncbi:MAG: hypothetical protein LBD20_06345 [Spirochaetaceae bacterium]|jgi:hypothetical protein|nr:hypothetical protein [Spirochaetaceae bacterium]
MYASKFKALPVDKYKVEIYLGCGGILLFILSMFIPPIADDWAYLASPRIQEFRLAAFRRICDVLIGMFLQSHPTWFPRLNSVLIIVSHTACAILFYKISVNFLKIKARISLFFAFAFLIGGNTIITVFNYDCFNQTGSLLFGALGIYFFLKSKSIRGKFTAYFVFCILSLCVKESGIVYFAVIPLFGTIKNIEYDNFNIISEVKTLTAFYIPGFICALLYYFSPIIQSEKVFVYGSGYSIGQYIIGIFSRLVFAYSQVSHNALNRFKGTVSISSLSVTSAGILLSLPILVISAIVIIDYIKNKSIQFLLILLLILNSIIIFTPTLMASYSGSPHNMNCIVFFANFVFCRLMNTIDKKRVLLCVTAFGMAALISSTNTYIQFIHTSIRQRKSIEKISALLSKEKINTYIVYNINRHQTKKGGQFPATLYNMQQIFGHGSQLMPVVGYSAKSTTVQICNEKLETKGIANSGAAYFNLSDEDLLLYVQQEAQNAVKSGSYDLALILLPNDEFYLYQ